jgi:hypothetical protein
MQPGNSNQGGSSSATPLAGRAITVRVTRNYGNEVVYPADESAELFAQLAGTRTLTRASITLIKQLGYEISVQQEVAEL